MICTAPRSGSTLLCRMLAATGVAGNPGSHFHAASLDRWLEVYGLQHTRFASRRDALRAVFDAAKSRGRGATEVFGLRMQGGSCDHFLEQLAALVPGETRDVARFEAEFGPTLFLHLSRSDRLGQAISRLRAEQSGLWHRHADGSELERTAAGLEPRYDAGEIARHMAELAAFDAAWERWFKQEAVTPLRLGYDDLSVDPRGTLGRVLQALGLDPALARSVEVPTARLADGLSRNWRARFKAEAGGAA